MSPNLERPIFADRRNLITSGTPINGINFIRMSGQITPHGLQVPALDGTIPAPTNELATISRPCDIVYGVDVSP